MTSIVSGVPRREDDCTERERRIVRDEEILGGRWHFEGTSIPIAAICSDFQAAPDDFQQQYSFAGLTDAEIKAALTFDFPEIRPPQIQVQYASVNVSCACGEDSHVTMIGQEEASVRCPCGRSFRARLTLGLADDTLT